MFNLICRFLIFWGDALEPSNVYDFTQSVSLAK